MILEQERLVDLVAEALSDSLRDAVIELPDDDEEDEPGDISFAGHVVQCDADGDIVFVSAALSLDVIARAVVERIGFER